MSREIKSASVRLDAFKTSKEIQFAVQSGPLLMENGVINSAYSSQRRLT